MVRARLLIGTRAPATHAAQQESGASLDPERITVPAVGVSDASQHRAAARCLLEMHRAAASYVTGSSMARRGERVALLRDGNRSVARAGKNGR